jgi:hypothetical protein
MTRTPAQIAAERYPLPRGLSVYSHSSESKVCIHERAAFLAGYREAERDRAAVIEECAQIADRNGGWTPNHPQERFQLLNRGRNDSANRIAKAIRALAALSRAEQEGGR